MKQRISAQKKVQIEKFLHLVLPAFTILFVGAIVIFSVLIYKISHPEALPEAVNPSHYLLPSLEIEIPTNNGEEIPGWWIPGLKNAPGIILAPGYGMDRGDALSLAASLHRNGFNTLVYSQRGSQAGSQKSSTLGLLEAGDMLGAVRFLLGRQEINQTKLGIWGVDIGARAALKATATFPEIRALAVDSPFDSIEDFLDYRISEDFGLDNQLVQFGCFEIFRLVHLFSGVSLGERLPYRALSDRAILFIKGENRRELGLLTDAIYDKIEPQKEMISFKTARIHSMSGEDLKSYDRQVTSFFLLHLQ